MLGCLILYIYSGNYKIKLFRNLLFENLFSMNPERVSKWATMCACFLISQFLNWANMDGGLVHISKDMGF
jgi:hypothetical protein